MREIVNVLTNTNHGIRDDVDFIVEADPKAKEQANSVLEKTTKQFRKHIHHKINKNNKNHRDQNKFYEIRTYLRKPKVLEGKGIGRTRF